MMRYYIYILILCFSIGVTSDAFAKKRESKKNQIQATIGDTIAAPTVSNVASDKNKDGKPDRWEYFDRGTLVRIEADTNYDGSVDEWAKVSGEKIVSAEKDVDYDGKVDKWITYDQ